MQTLPEATELDWARLNDRLAALEARVNALEHPEESSASVGAVAFVADDAVAAHTATEETARAGGIFPLLGKALLGIAGAYLLRALAESGALPQMIVAIAAILFAAFWMVWARRAEKTDKLASAIYAGTSALIFAPMLWELTLSFHLLNTVAAASILGAYSAAAMALAWQRENSPAAWIGNFTGTALAVALAFATHDPAVFLVVLMLLAALTEFATLTVDTIGQRALNSAAIDFALWATLFIYAGNPAGRVDYAALSNHSLIFLSLIPLLIYVASVLAKTAILGKRIMLFECAQLGAVFILASTGLIEIGGASGQLLLGIVCISFAILSYALAFTRFYKMEARRNTHVFASWSVALILAGCWLLLSANITGVLLSLIALLAIVFGAKRLSLGFHGVIYLAAAAFASGLAAFIVSVLVGSFPSTPAWPVWICVFVALASYVAALRIQGDGWPQRALQLSTALLAVSTVTAVLHFAIVELAMNRATTAEHHLDLVRTLTVCVLALALAFAGARWQRRELAWMDYGMLVLIGGKIVFSSPLHNHLSYFAATIFFYALTFILMPRMVRLGQRNA